MRYRDIVNSIALQTLDKDAQRPEFKLMVGGAERLSPVPVLIYARPPVKQAKPVVAPVKREDDLALQGTTYSPEDFPQGTFYLGASLEGGF